MSAGDGKPTPKQLSPQEWESLIDSSAADARNHSPATLLDLAVPPLLRRDFPLPTKISILVYLESALPSLLPQSHPSTCPRLLDLLRSLLQSPDATYPLKDQSLVSVTSVFVSLLAPDDFPAAATVISGLVELLLIVINRPNHGVDRHTRGIACECLRQLEIEFPCLLSDVVGHLWSLCQLERSHATQNYALLFAQVTRDIAVCKVDVSLVNTAVPLIPFNCPDRLVSLGGSVKESVLGSGLNFKELRKAMAFMLECAELFTPCAMMELMELVMPVALTLELQASMLRVQFFRMVHSYDAMLCHFVLRLFLLSKKLLSSGEGREKEDEDLTRRLVSISREAHCNLVFRLLAVHWLVGFVKEKEKGKTLVDIGLGLFYPSIFDPLALKALKLDVLAFCSAYMSEDDGLKGGSESLSVVKLFEDGLVSVSGFKWMPSGSTETIIAFRMYHKFLIGTLCLSEGKDLIEQNMMFKSVIFCSLQMMLVEMAMEFPRLVPPIVAFIDRLLGCHKHCLLAERLLQKFDESLLPKLSVDYKLVLYFKLFDRIAGNKSIPPSGLLDVLMNLMVFIVKKHSLETRLRSWSQGSKVLSLCRTMMMHQKTSRLFVNLSQVLAFTCLYFPDLEVRDNARIYVRMLTCVPGTKLREILKYGEELPSIAPSAQSVPFFNGQFPESLHDPKKCRNLSAYVHLERMVPLIVKQSWSLSLSGISFGSSKFNYLEGIQDSELILEDTMPNSTVDDQVASENEDPGRPLGSLRIMDSGTSEMLETLRKYFSGIPDYRHFPGIKIIIPCYLRFDSEPFGQLWGFPSSTGGESDAIEALPAIYATVLKFSSTAPYGSIPPSRVPFLLGEPSRKSDTSVQHSGLEIIPIENGSTSDDSYKAPVSIELEPREPTPGIVDVLLETNAESGQIICGQLRSIPIAIEDMFLNAIVPSDIPEDEVPRYRSRVFSSLWEACNSSSDFGREIFPLKGGKAVAAIRGTRSVKLLDAPVSSVIESTTRHLSSFVTCVIGEPLIDIVKDDGIISGAEFKDIDYGSLPDANLGKGPLRLTYTGKEDGGSGSGSGTAFGRGYMGCLHVLIFLPPMYHLLLQMEVCDYSTLVRIRTDHWPCLAYIDDYLEALYLT
ncbi:hypothetical protein MLD38_009900 [Melastoma candidum]|uniref:Uncharacterized protein n=1 Tax=Melastoma candidum TaxID=119954 RepID=A0ACB9RYF2_9MYRT|nr:hypothetical protein MLD38_009900 [Melastoma candidum]